MIALEQLDFRLIGQLASHCDRVKLQISINESIEFDFEPLLCDLFIDVDTNWNSVDDIWLNLIAGSTYTGCKDKEKKHPGLKKVLLYYSYARYIMINGFNDTPNGHVNKDNPFSFPKTYKELKSFSDKYRSMGYKSFEKIKPFLCLNKDDYVNFDSCGCASCGCDGCCGSKTTVKGYSIRGKNVSKWDV